MTPGRFIVTTQGGHRVDLQGLCKKVVNDLWIPPDLTDAEAAAYALDWFKRAVVAELELLEVRAAQSAE